MSIASPPQPSATNNDTMGMVDPTTIESTNVALTAMTATSAAESISTTSSEFLTPTTSDTSNIEGKKDNDTHLKSTGSNENNNGLIILQDNLTSSSTTEAAVTTTTIETIKTQTKIASHTVASSDILAAGENVSRVKDDSIDDDDDVEEFEISIIEHTPPKSEIVVEQSTENNVNKFINVDTTTGSTKTGSNDNSDVQQSSAIVVNKNETKQQQISGNDTTDTNGVNDKNNDNHNKQESHRQDIPSDHATENEVNGLNEQRKHQSDVAEAYEEERDDLVLTELNLEIDKIINNANNEIDNDNIICYLDVSSNVEHITGPERTAEKPDNTKKNLDTNKVAVTNPVTLEDDEFEWEISIIEEPVVIDNQKNEDKEISAKNSLIADPSIDTGASSREALQESRGPQVSGGTQEIESLEVEPVPQVDEIITSEAISEGKIVASNLSQVLGSEESKSDSSIGSSIEPVLTAEIGPVGTIVEKPLEDRVGEEKGENEEEKGENEGEKGENEEGIEKLENQQNLIEETEDLIDQNDTRKIKEDTPTDTAPTETEKPQSYIKSILLEVNELGKADEGGLQEEGEKLKVEIEEEAQEVEPLKQRQESGEDTAIKQILTHEEATTVRGSEADNANYDRLERQGEDVLEIVASSAIRDNMALNSKSYDDTTCANSRVPKDIEAQKTDQIPASSGEKPTVLQDSQGGEKEASEEDEEPIFVTRQVVVQRNVDPRSRYSLQEELGRGKFGTVFKCVEQSSGTKLAAKFISMRRREDREDVEREIDIMRSLQHKRLLQLYDAFDDGQNEMCLVMELVEGGELFERVIDDDFKLTEKMAGIFMRQICEGVQYMQEQNIVHLDMKPENILCVSKQSNRIKLIDFGLARRFVPNAKLQVLFGTPDFASPEVLSYDKVTLATDMWSVGVICYVLLSGLSPFMGNNDMETMVNVTNAAYDFDDDAFDPISDSAKDFISRLLIKDQELRMTPSECLNHSWLTKTKLSSSKSCANNEDGNTDDFNQSLDKTKLRKYVVRRRWQKAIHAIMALGRMGATLQAKKRQQQQ